MAQFLFHLILFRFKRSFQQQQKLSLLDATRRFYLFIDFFFNFIFEVWLAVAATLSPTQL